MKNIYDLRGDAPRYVIEAMVAAKRPLSSYELADHYDPPKPNNMAELRSDYREKPSTPVGSTTTTSNSG